MAHSIEDQVIDEVVQHLLPQLDYSQKNFKCAICDLDPAVWKDMLQFGIVFRPYTRSTGAR
jgi:hypothetical protein